MTQAYVGLGANLGEPRRQVEAALSELDALPRTRLKKRSSLYRSAPVGYPGQPDYVNAVAELETGLGPHELLGALQEIELRHGRSRSFANAPRTLDLDILLFGDTVVSQAGLTIPHPRMHERAFVLRPLLEVAPRAQIPGKGTAAELLGACAGQSVERLP
ncbi:MAG TPA: 2-amino-4-hydroxy-6-hydroxymethyldihydropteridine diphosphokinase [Burkholderiales bacterium]|nr:2-amino-4-hydroxy-6-hydroxymethyldihydropteridine diphosphokinase [Burkholderiales bacterium]